MVDGSHSPSRTDIQNPQPNMQLTSFNEKKKKKKEKKFLHREDERKEVEVVEKKM